MIDNAITFFQLFGIGFTFGIAGPCLLLCTPILVTYIAGKNRKWGESFFDLLLFLSGRLSAYIILGFLAGLSGKLLREFVNPKITLFFKPLAGIISILLGVSILFYKEAPECRHENFPGRAYSASGLAGLGFMVGISPCAPLMALLFEIALMSKNAFAGSAYALSFGLGTFFSGLIVIGLTAGLLRGLAARLLRSERSNLIFRILCAGLLILFGVGLILQLKAYGLQLNG